MSSPSPSPAPSPSPVPTTVRIDNNNMDSYAKLSPTVAQKRAEVKLNAMP